MDPRVVFSTAELRKFLLADTALDHLVLSVGYLVEACKFVEEFLNNDRCVIIIHPPTLPSCPMVCLPSLAHLTVFQVRN